MSRPPAPPIEKSISPKRAATRSRLLESTLALLAVHGLHRLSLDAIAAHAGVTKGAVYDNFESKDALIAAAIASQPRVEADAFVWPKGRQGSVRARLRRLGQAVIDGYRSSPQSAIGSAEFLLYTLTHEDFRARLGEMFNRGPRRAIENVEALFAPGELGMSPEAFSILLNSLVPGLMYNRMLSTKPMSDELVLSIFEGLAGPD